MTITTTTRLVLAYLLLAAALLGAGCTDGGQSVTGPAATEFLSETASYDDRVEFRFVPDSDGPGTYSATCRIERNVSWGTTIETRENVQYEDISRAKPIEIVVPRDDPSDGAAVEIEIRSLAGDVLHQSRTSVAPATPVPTPP